MKKTGVILVILMLMFLAGCGGKADTKPYTPPVTGNVVEETETAPSEPVEQEPSEPEGPTAAEALKDLTQDDIDVETSSAKSASSLYGGITVEGEGKDAFKAKTKALYRQSSPVGEDIDADREFGSRFDNLPSEYDNDDSAGE